MENACDEEEEPVQVSSIKCASCGNRILLPTDREACANCGALIVQQILAAHQPAEVEYLFHPPEPGVQPLLGSTISRRESQQLHLPATDEEDQSSSDEPTDKIRALQLYRDRTSLQRQDRSLYQPYQSAQIAPIDPRSNLLPIPLDMSKVDNELPSLSPLPRGFPQRPPDLVGTVIHVQSQMENPLTPDGAEFFLKMFRDIIWAMPQESQQPRSVHVTSVRIRTENGLIKDARLEGYMRGVSISLGDTISFWGRRRKGLVLVYRGYNHTSKGIVKTTASTSVLTVLLMLIVFIFICYLIFNGLHLHLPNLLHRP